MGDAPADLWPGGSVQLLGCAAVLALLAVALGVPWRLAVVASLGLAMSSTAIGHGRAGRAQPGPHQRR